MTTVAEYSEKLFIKYPRLKPSDELTEAQQERVNLFIQDSINELEIEKDFFGKNYETMLLLLTAHFYYDSGEFNTTSGIIENEKDEKKSTTYAKVKQVELKGYEHLNLYSTTYGRSFISKYLRIDNNDSTIGVLLV